MLVTNSSLVRQGWSLANNGTILKIDDMQIDCSIWLLAKLMASAVLLVEIITGWKLIGAILGYLERKPPGEQSLMDIFHRIMFTSIQWQCLAVFIQILIRRIFLDTGHILASLYMWVMYDCSSVTVMAIGLNPLVQLILARNPGIQLPLSDATVYWLSKITLWLPLLIMNVICSALGCNPPSYNYMRDQELEHPAFVYVRSIILGLFLIAFIAANLIIRCGQKSSTEPAKHLMNNKVMLAFCTILILILIFVACNIMIYLVELIMILLVILLPMIMIATNENLHQGIKLHHPLIAKVIDSATKCMRKRSSRVDPKPPTVETIELHKM